MVTAAAPMSVGLVGSQDSAVVRIHLDANANAPVTPAVKAAVIEALESGNPSSAHAGGDEGRAVLADARDAVAGLFEGAFPEDVVFTSGCTEANNLIVATARAIGATLITTSVEHASLTRPAQAFAADRGTVFTISVDHTGRLDLHALADALEAAAGPVVLSVQAANSETGVLQPLDVIASLISGRTDVLFHSDAAQRFGKEILTLGNGRGPDVFTISGHKVHAPMGVGAIVFREGEDRLRPVLLGGDQESGLRAGTQPVPLIAGFGAACADRRRSLADQISRMRVLRDRLESRVCLALPSVRVNGGEAPRLPNTSNLRFPGVDAIAMLAQLDAHGVLASQGSACHSRRPEPSPVLMAMGLSEDEAFASVRFSVSHVNTEVEIDYAASIIVGAARRLGIRT